MDTAKTIRDFKVFLTLLMIYVESDYSIITHSKGETHDQYPYDNRANPRAC